MGLKVPKRVKWAKGLPHSPASLTDLEEGTMVLPQRARTAVAIMSQNFQSFRVQWGKHPGRAVGRELGRRGSETQAPFVRGRCCVQCPTLPGLRFSSSGPGALAETKVP